MADTSTRCLCSSVCRCSSLHHRDFAASLDYLHRFFDHTVDARPAPAPPAAAGQAPQDAAAAARERGRMQSAALSLGSMHAQFGHIEEAMQALNETVGGGWAGQAQVGGLGGWEPS
jgi:hypothetical protein